MRIYLSGAIEYAPDHGRHWRAALTPLLEAQGHQVYDPARDAKKNLSDYEVQHFRSWKTTDLERFKNTVRKIIAYDLEWIERRTDAIVCYWDEHCMKGAGTQAELTFAHRWGLPVYLIVEMPLEKVSGWVLACSTEVFSSVGELEAHFAKDIARQEVRAE